VKVGHPAAHLFSKEDAMLVIHPESHVDHVQASVIEAVKRVLADAGNPDHRVIIETFELPEEAGTVDCALYGPAMGDPPVPEDQVQYGERPGRSWPSRLVARPVRQTRTLTVVAGPHQGHDLVLFTGYGGPAAPPEVDDPHLRPADRAASVAFWKDHALALRT
jgi:hypothetical protein